MRVNAKRTWTENCGCKHDNFRWIILCLKHQTEVDQTHEQWQREYEQSMKKEVGNKIGETS